MGIDKIFLALIIAGVLLIIGFAIFPSFHVGINEVDTTGFSTLMAGFVRFAPYALFGAIIYGAIVIMHKRG